MTLADLLAEAKRLDEAATRGPWGAVRVATLDYGDGFVASVPARDGDMLFEYAISAPEVASVPAETGAQDAALIAFARTALPRLVRVAEAAMEMRGWLNTGHAYEGGCPDAVEPRSLDPEKLADASGPSADNAGPASPAGGADSRGSAASSPSLGANSARTTIDCFNCAALRGTSRLLAESALFLIDRNAELTRELEELRARERRMRGEG